MIRQRTLKLKKIIDFQAYISPFFVFILIKPSGNDNTFPLNVFSLYILPKAKKMEAGKKNKKKYIYT